MLTNDLSNNNIPASAPLPPPPLPLGGLKNWTLPQDNGNSKKPSNVATSGISSRTEPKKGQSKSPVQQSSLNFAENTLFKKKQEEHNVNSETADEGSNIRQSEPNRGLTPKPVSPRVLSPQQDNGNSNKPSGTNNSTQSEKGLSENPIQLATEQKIDTPILVNTSVGISKATALKYSIATLLLCISSVTAGIYTYLSISVTLSDPVLFTVIAFVSASVMLSLAAYLINSHLSAINSEKGVDPGRKQSQYSELQKEAENLEHSNTIISSPKMSGTPIVPPLPPLPPVKPNDLSTAVIRKSSTSDANQKDVQQKQSDTPVDDRSNLLAQIRKGITLKQAPDKYRKDLSKDHLKIPQKQEEESTPGKQENGVQPLNNGVYQIRKVESQKTDKEPSNSEGMQQKDSMDSLERAILEQRRKNGFQDEQLDSLDDNDHQEDSLFCLEEEQFKTASQEQKKCVQQPDAALSILKDKYIETQFIPSNSFFNSNSEECKQDLDDENWDTEPYSIPYIYPDKTKQEKMKDRERHNHNCSSSSSTQVNNVEPASSEMQESSTVSVQEIRKRFE